jgi:hypothetical protein
MKRSEQPKEGVQFTVDIHELLTSWRSDVNKPKRELLDWLLMRHLETKQTKLGEYKITLFLSKDDYQYLHLISPTFKSMCR